MTATATVRRGDPRLDPPAWQPLAGRAGRGRVALLVALNVLLAAWYFGWLLQPARVGNPVLYGLLVTAELFNLVQALGFWWTSLHDRVRRAVPWHGPDERVDVLVPVYGEPVGVVEPTIAAATALRGARVTVHLLDDGQDPAMAEVARRHGAQYLTRERHTGGKAGNINAALQRTDAPYVLVLDCDHVPRPELLERTLGHLAADPGAAFVQTPQYYANARDGGVPAAAWAQQALFFGGIARGKDGLRSMFCCGTNVVFRRAALAEVGGFPERSVTEDFELSIRLHERGWRSVYHPEVLACGLGPENMSAYVTQQLRWARGCLGGIASSLRSRLPWRRRLQYLLSSMYFLSGWTVLIYMSLPVVRILTGQQPLAQLSADQFLLHFAPYFLAAIATVAVVGAGSYTYAGFTLAAASFWIHIVSTVRAALRRSGAFKVTAKGDATSWQPVAVLPGLAVAAVLLGTAVYGVSRGLTPSMANNVGFAVLHLIVISGGVAPALRRPRRRGKGVHAGQRVAYPVERSAPSATARWSGARG